MNRVGIGYEINEDYRELITRRINEKWAVPDWRQIDLIHSTTMEPGMKEPRKLQFLSLKRAQQKLL